MSTRRFLPAFGSLLVSLCSLHAADRCQDYLNRVIDGVRTDAERAEKVFESVQAVADDAELSRFLLAKCYEYAVRGAQAPEAYDCGHKALTLLAGQDQAWAAQRREKLIKLHEAALRSRSPEVAFRAAWGCAECLVGEGDDAVKLGDWAKAYQVYRQAEAAIRSRKLGWGAPVAAKASHARYRQTAEAGRKRLAEAMASKPDDVSARERLIAYCVAELDDPAAGAELVTDGCSQFLRQYLPIAVGPMDQRSAAACGELGNWYAALARSAKTGLVGRAVCLLRAKANYDRFLSLYDKRDPTRVQIEQGLGEVAKALSATNPETLGVAWLVGRQGQASTGAVSAAMLAGAQGGVPLPPDAGEAVARGLAYLLTQQDPTGQWLYTLQKTHEGNPAPDRSTVLAACALLQAGVPAVHPALARALSWLDGRNIVDPQALGVRANVWVLANEQLSNRYARNLQADLRSLLAMARPVNGYGSARDTFCATWGVACCAAARLPVPPKYWEVALGWWVKTQRQDGGWPDDWGRDEKAKTLPKYTVPGLASLLFCSRFLSRCPPAVETARRSATTWFDTHADKGVFVLSNGGWEGELYESLWYLAVGAAPMGGKLLGSTDWYEKGKNALLKTQRRDGSWPRGHYNYHDEVSTTSYAVLFLTQGRRTAGMTDMAAVDELIPQLEWIRTGPSQAPLREHAGYKEISRNAVYKISAVGDNDWNRSNAFLLSPEEPKGASQDSQVAFQTASSFQPHVIIRLDRPHAVRYVSIRNRLKDAKDRAKELTMWLSDDGEKWTEVWQAKDVQDEWLIDLGRESQCTFLKIGLKLTGILHLFKVTAFGK